MGRLSGNERVCPVLDTFGMVLNFCKNPGGFSGFITFENLFKATNQKTLYCQKNSQLCKLN